MIKRTMRSGEEIQQRNLPCDFLSLKVSLYQISGIPKENDDLSASIQLRRYKLLDLLYNVLPSHHSWG